MNVLIVGASRGMGWEFTKQYLAAGACVYATARDTASVARLQAVGAQAFLLDITDTASVAQLSGHLDRQLVDVALVVAGVLVESEPAVAPSRHDFDRVMHANVWGPMQILPVVAQALAPAGKLVVMSSRMGSIALRTSGGNWLYRASKAAVNSVMKDISFGLQGRATCVAMHPGWVKTEMGGQAADLEVSDSVTAMRATIAQLEPKHHASFLNYDGQTLDW